MKKDPDANSRGWLWFFYIPLSIIYLEAVFRVFAVGGLSVSDALFTLLFSLSAGFLLTLLCSFGPKGLRRALAGLFLLALTLLYGVQTVYKEIFQEYLGVGLLGVGGDAITGFWSETVSGFVRCLPAVALLLLPLALWLALSRRLAPERVSGRQAALAAAAFVLFQTCASASVRLSGGGGVSPAFTYTSGFVMRTGVSRFGLLTAQRLDIQHTLLPRAALETPEAAPSPTSTPEPEPDRLPQVTEIDFDALIAAEGDPNVKSMHQFFAAAEPSYTNEYTGAFKGRNLIWLVAEAFSPWGIDQTHTPTLYKLANTGFVFDNFYCPITSASTTGGEFITLTGLMQNTTRQLMWLSCDNYMPYGMGNLLNSRGYASLAYHNGQYTYYGRNESLPNLGYEFRANGHGLTLDEPGLMPTSDEDMIINSVADYIGSEPFNIYYMTISGHMEYNFRGGQDMCSRYEDQVTDLTGYTERARAYAACCMDLDRAMERLLEALDQAGILDDTVIVMSPDHYPYSLKTEDIESIVGRTIDEAFDLEHSTLILWSGDIAGESVHIDKPCSSVDVLPTLLNLFGIQFDSRLLMGRDILSDSDGFVAFRNYSFISPLGRYDSARDLFTPAAGAPEPEEGYVARAIERVQLMYRFSQDIIDHDYYARVFGAD